MDAINVAVEESAKGVGNVTERSASLSSNVGDITNEASMNLQIAEQLDVEVKRFKLE